MWRGEIVGGVVQLSPSIAGALGRTVLMTSDAKDRVLRIIPIENRHVLMFRVQFPSDSDALERVVRAVAADFQLVTSFSRVLNSTEWQVEMVISGRSGQVQREDLMRVLRTAGVGGARVCFPRSVVEDSVWQVLGDNDPGETPMSPTWLDARSTAEWCRVGAESLRTREVSESRKDRYRALRDRINVLRRIDFAEKNDPAAEPEIFVSYRWAKKHLRGPLKEALEARRWAYQDGQDPAGKPSYRKVIRDRIEVADGFVGIWDEEAHDVGTWLYWELGVAEALRKPYVLLVHKSAVDRALQVNPELHHLVYSSELELRSLPEDALKTLQERFERESLEHADDMWLG